MSWANRPVSSDKKASLAFVFSLAREMTGTLPGDEQDEANEWLDRVERCLSRGVGACSRCGQAGHKVTTCPSPSGEPSPLLAPND
jgi:hypothetical protein